MMKFTCIIKSLTFLICAVLALTTPAVSGHSHWIEGEARSLGNSHTLLIGSDTIRLWGIDSPDNGQKCLKAQINCGLKAYRLFKALLKESTVKCEAKDYDDHGRFVGTCWVNEKDIAMELAKSGFVHYQLRPDSDSIPHEAANPYMKIFIRNSEQKIGLWEVPTLHPRIWRKTVGLDLFVKALRKKE